MMVKSVNQENKKIWEDEIKKNIMLYPDERVAAFVAGNYKNQDNSNKRAIDIGCGSGRNLIPLLDCGFQCYGIDYNEECCKVAKELLKDRDNLKEIYHEDLQDMGVEEEFFDVVIIHGVLFLAEYKEMMQNLKKINKFMKKGGKILVNFRNKQNSIYDEATKIGDKTYRINKEGPYKGSLFTFLDFEECEQLLKESGFNILNCEKVELYKNNLSERHSWFVFTAERK